MDIQGGGIELFDPEIASSELFDDNEMLLILSENLSEMAISNFKAAHQCDQYCKILGLNNLD